MRILIANNIYPPIIAGGAELIVSYLAERLVKRGHEVVVVSTCAPEMEPYLTHYLHGVEVVRFFPQNYYWNFTRGDRPAYKKVLWHIRDAWNFDTASKFEDLLKEHKPDIIHTHLLDGFSASLWGEANKANIPVVHTAHDYHLICPRAMMLTKSLKLCTNPTLGCQIYRKWHLFTTRYVDLFCSPSQFLINQHQEAGLKALNTAVVRNGIPLPAPKEKIRSKGKPLQFLFLSRLTEEKGSQVVLDALKFIPLDLPFELIVAGKGDYEQAFKDAAAQDPRIRFMGYISGETKNEILSNADCLLIPSLWYENAPVVIVEAAAYGLAVIGSNIGAIPEFVQDGETGLLFEAGSAMSLANAIKLLLREPSLIDTYTTASKSLLKDSSVDAMTDNYLNYYHKLLGHE